MTTIYKIFETERLTLKPTDLEDAGFVFELMNTPKWLKYIGDKNIKNIDQAKVYITNNAVAQRERMGYSNYILERKEDRKKIGICGLYDREGLQGIDIGFAFLPQYEKRGYAFEATTQLMEMAFKEFGIGELSAIVTKDNIASQRLLEKLGFERNGTTKLPKSDKELLLYQIHLKA